jgi:hypothetical protein
MKSKGEKKMWKRPLHPCSLLALVAFPMLVAAQTRGYVEGVLTDAAAKPAAGFQVSIVGTSPTSTYHVEVTTDENGKFAVRNLEFGSYLATPHLDTVESRYPPGTSAFFDKHLARFTLSQESPGASLSMTLDAPCLIISGTVSDGVAGNPVIATIRMWHREDKEKWVRLGSSAQGKYRTWIPANEAIEITVSAEGYEMYRTTLQPIENGVDPVLDVALSPRVIGPNPK